MNKPHYLYVIGKYTDLNGPCKLGISVNPDRRLKQLQTGQSELLTVHHREEAPADKVRLFERLLHRDIHHLRLSGEWFDLTVEHAIQILQHTLIRYGDVDDLEEKMRCHRI